MNPATAAAAAALIITSSLTLTMGFATKTTKATPTGRGEVAMPDDDCIPMCGHVQIRYPFGVGDDEKCFLDNGFKLDCDDDSKLWTTQFRSRPQSRVLGIDPAWGTMEISMPVSRFCGGVVPGINTNFTLGVEPRTFRVSGDENRLFAVGCDAYAILHAGEETEPRSSWIGCSSRCPNGKPDGDDIKECSGTGCCNATVPAGTRDIAVDAYPFAESDDGEGRRRRRGGYRPNCSYALVAKSSWFRDRFLLTDLTKKLHFTKSHLIIEWAVGEEGQTCGSDGHRFCAGVGNSTVECVDTKTRSGYRCRCRSGYGGNPYLGCHNIDECKEGTNSCHRNATCNNILGSYTCTCKKGFEGDGMKDGKGCVPKSRSNNTLLVICLGVSLSSATLLAISFFIYWGLKKRRLIKLKEKFFQQNGGLILQQQLGSGNGERMKIYTLKVLKKATNNFDEKLILGQGGYGTVYKGVLDGSVTVAIKKSRICDQSQVEPFINEVVVLSQVNHRNVVNLLGCCLEAQVPLLVYEFINNGTLSDHLHNGNNRFPKMSFATRLRVAAESAGALSYLHSAASPPIIHRDVKTSNILLDERLTAKVSDFGTSRLVPLDHSQITTLVRGTFGYLDPEYFYSGQLTEKSDVYSFGVVLAELLTGEKAISFSRPEEDINLGAYFVSSLNNGRLAEVLDNHIVTDGVMSEHILGVAKIARRCLNVRKDDRPTMKEVAMELEGLRNHLDEKDNDHHPNWGLGDENEMSSRETQRVSKKSMIMSFRNVDGGDSYMSIVSGESSGNIDMNLISMSLIRDGR